MEKEANGRGSWRSAYLPTKADPVRNGMWLTIEKRGCFSKPGLRGHIWAVQRLSSSGQGLLTPCTGPREGTLCTTQCHTASRCL